MEDPKLRAQSLVSLVLIFTLTLATQAQESPQPKTVLVERGKILELSLVTPLDSGQARVGDDVPLKLVRPLVADGEIVLPTDSILHGRVTKVAHAGKNNCKDGYIGWKLNRVAMKKGKKIQLQEIDSYLAQRGGVAVDRVSLPTTKHENTAVKYIELSPLIVLMAPYIIMMLIAYSHDEQCHGLAGKDESIAAGTHLFAAVSKDVTLSVSN